VSKLCSRTVHGTNVKIRYSKTCL